MKKLFFTLLVGLLFLTSSNAGAAATSPQMDCVMRIYSTSTGETLGYVLVYNVSCCNCASTKALALSAF